MNRRLASIFGGSLAAVLLALSACSPQSPKFENTDITGINYARDFSLTDQNGKVRTLADFRGKAVVVFFGYTQCPDVCPTTMADMAAAVHKMGPDGDKVQVLFITLDPERDTATVLKAYVPAFDKSFLGLYGTAAQTEQVAKEFKVFYEKVPGPTPTSYSMDHSAGSYVFDRQGQPRLFIRNRQGSEPVIDPIVHDLEILARS